MEVHLSGHEDRSDRLHTLHSQTKFQLQVYIKICSITCILIENAHQIIVVVTIGFCYILKWDDKCGIHIMIKPLLYTLKYLQMDKAQAMALCSIAASTTEFSSTCMLTDKVFKLGVGGNSVTLDSSESTRPSRTKSPLARAVC